MSLSYLYTEFMDLMRAAPSLSSFFFFPGSSHPCSHSLFGLLLPTNLTLSPMLSSVPTLRFFLLPQPCLPNLPNAMRLNFSWTQGSRQPHLLVTHWLTRIRLSGSLSSHIIQGFPPCTLRVTPLHFSSSACPERRLGSPGTHKVTKVAKSPSRGNWRWNFFSQCSCSLGKSPGSCFATDLHHLPC